MPLKRYPRPAAKRQKKRKEEPESGRAGEPESRIDEEREHTERESESRDSK